MRLLTLLLATVCLADSSRVLKLEPGVAPGKAAIGDMRWLAGQWQGTGLGGVAEEVWSSPAGGAMQGMFRVLRDGKVYFYELCTIVEDNGSLLLRIKHFGPDLKGWEAKDESREFRLVKVDEQGAWFDGLSFLRKGGNEMTAWVLIRGKDGKVSEASFPYRRTADLKSLP